MWFELRRIDSAQAEACATDSRKTCATTARGDTGRELPKSSREKCQLATKQSPLVVAQLRPSNMNLGKHTRMPQRLAGRSQKKHVELPKLPVLPAAFCCFDWSWGTIWEAIYTFPDDRIPARAAMSYWSVICPENEAPGLWRKWLAVM